MVFFWMFGFKYLGETGTLQLRFDQLAQCSDQTAVQSPYRMAVFTCLKGTVSIRKGSQPLRQCQLQRVSYFPANQRVRYWTATCR